MSTDTALLTTKLIIEHDYLLEDLPFINEPTIEGINSKGHFTSIIMEGFIYLTREIDPITGERLEKS
jgi:ribosome biogenesis SPOUT family RNA methylase Rps3